MSPDDQVLAAFTAGQTAWPTVTLTHPRFAEYLRLNAVRAEDAAVHAGDLYLAYACAEGEPRAVRAFEQHYIANVDLYVARSGVPAELLCEVRQKVRMKLLVGANPGIRRYRGRAPLTALVRVTAVRVASDVAAQAGQIRKAQDNEILDMLVAADAGPEIDAARELYRDRFRAAISDSLASLGAREKTLLRLHFVDGLNIEGIGALYRVHRATVARWLVTIRDRVFADLRQKLALQLGTSPSELRSMVQLLGEDIDLSARRILGAPGNH